MHICWPAESMPSCNSFLVLPARRSGQLDVVTSSAQFCFAGLSTSLTEHVGQAATLYTQMLSQAGAQSVWGCSCTQSMCRVMMNFYQSQTKRTLRTSLSAGARLTLLMLPQVLLVVAVITDPGHHSWLQCGLHPYTAVTLQMNQCTITCRQ